MIHRDLKPGNIGLCFEGISSDVFVNKEKAAEFLKNFDFVKNEGSYKIKFFDLGMSETVDENGFGSTSKTGTPFYSSPEQLRGGF